MITDEELFGLLEQQEPDSLLYKALNELFHRRENQSLAQQGADDRHYTHSLNERMAYLDGFENCYKIMKVGV